MLAALNHPHIATVYGIEQGALVNGSSAAFRTGIPKPLFKVRSSYPWDVPSRADACSYQTVIFAAFGTVA